MATEHKPRLYGAHSSSATWRVRLILAWKNIDYDRSIVRPMYGEQHEEEYSKVNPSEKVPTFITSEGRRLTQSMAILQYIEEAYPDSRTCLPSDLMERALVREVCNEIACDIHPIQNTGLRRDFVGDSWERFEEWARVHIARGFNGLEAKLRETKENHLPGKFCVGDNVTMADFCLVPQVANAVKYKVDLSSFPIIRSIVENCKALPEFQRAAPENQPDYEIPKPFYSL